MRITPTQFIYQAAQKTPTVTLPSGKTFTYDFPGVPAIEHRQHCWLCGGFLNGKGELKSKIIKDTFTDHSYARAPGADYICPACIWCLSYRELRNYSILATNEGLRHPSKNEIAEIILNPPDPPWFLCIAVSGQKWLHFKGKVNLNNSRYVVNLEEIKVVIEPKAYTRMFEVVERLYNGGFTKDEIERLDFAVHRIQKYGLMNLERDITMLQPYKGSRMIKLAAYLARKKDEET